MLGDLRPYPAYQDSGVPWADQLPAHWTLERAKWLLRKVDRPVRDEDGVVTCFRDGMVTLRQNRRTRGFTEALKEIGYQGIRRGDLVIHAMDAFAGAIGVSDSDGKGSPVYSVCASVRGSSPFYYAHVVREMAHSQWILALSKGIRERSTDFRYEAFGNQFVPVPPAPEQQAIVRFLDHADRKIRKYIRAKQNLIKLLEEQKQAIIHQAVTRGLDPNVRLKPSGVEWLGDVPEHWRVARLKWVTRLQRGYDLPADQRRAGPYPVISSGGPIDVHCEARCQGPGVVMGRYGSTDAVFYVETAFWPHNTSLFVTDFQGNLPRWCFFMLRTISKADHAGKSAVPGVDRKDLYEIVVAVPPVLEQDALVHWIEAETAQIDRAMASARSGIGLVRELRARLIADVVTGKLDVRVAAAALPDEPAEAFEEVELEPEDADTDVVEAEEVEA